MCFSRFDILWKRLQMTFKYRWCNYMVQAHIFGTQKLPDSDSFHRFSKERTISADSGLFFKIRVSKPGDFSVLSNKGWKYAVIASDNKNKVHLMAGANEISWTWIVMTREKNDRT